MPVGKKPPGVVYVPRYTISNTYKAEEPGHNTVVKQCRAHGTPSPSFLNGRHAKTGGMSTEKLACRGMRVKATAVVLLAANRSGPVVPTRLAVTPEKVAGVLSK